MSASPSGYGSAISTNVPTGNGDATKIGEIVLGLLPFVVLCAGVVMMNSPYDRGLALGIFISLSMTLILGGYLFILAALFYAWLKDFPRWSMPYLGYGLIFGLYLSFVATPGLEVFGIQMWGKQMWGLRACAPVALVVLLGLLFSGSRWKAFSLLFQNIWKDWTYLAYGLYGFLPLLLFIIPDEVDPVYTFWPTIIAVLFVLVGAGLHLAFAGKPYRAAFLLGGMFLSVLAVSLSSDFYWKTHDVDMQTFVVTPLNGPIPWMSIATGGLRSAFFWTMFLLLTGVVGLLHAWVEGAKKRAA